VSYTEFYGERNANVEKLFSFGSSHTYGVNFLFGDGSVKFISNGINKATFELLGSRADGQPANLSGQ
jgi:prepilin-type processing-associated H-X9-DG protein